MGRLDYGRGIFKRKGSSGAMSSNEAVLNVVKEFVEELTEESINAVEVNMDSNEAGIYTIDISFNMKY